MGDFLSQGPLFLFCLIFMMGIVVIVHEYGHYIVGRWFGAAVESFSVGFGKPIFERTDKHGTRWQLAALPSVTLVLVGLVPVVVAIRRSAR